MFKKNKNKQQLHLYYDDAYEIIRFLNELKKKRYFITELLRCSINPDLMLIFAIEKYKLSHGLFFFFSFLL